jgi:hypothetical protein
MDGLKVQRELRMLHKTSQQFPARLQPGEFLKEGGPEVVRIGRGEVRQASVLGVAPYRFVGIELRRVGRELRSDDSRVFAEKVPDYSCSLVNVASVPDDRHWPTQVTTKKLEKLDDVLSSYVLVVWHQLEVQTKAVSHRAQGDRTDCGDSIMAVPAPVDRRFPTRRVRSPDEGRKHEA